MIKLYHISPANDSMGGSRNAAKVSIALRELGEEFEAINLDREKDLRPPSAQYRKEINPNGVTPAIEDDGLILWESSAILRHLADTRGGLIGKDAKSKAITQQWLSWEGATFQPAFLGYYFAVLGNYQADLKESALLQYFDKLNILDQRLSRTGSFIAGDYSIADIALGMVIPIGFYLGIDLKNYKNVVRWLNVLSDRSAWRKEPAFNNDMQVGREKGYLPIKT